MSDLAPPRFRLYIARMPPKPKPGRPPAPPDEKRSIRLQVRVTPAEYAWLVADAGSTGKLSEWVRVQILARMRRAVEQS